MDRHLSVIVHGGAGNISAERGEKKMPGLRSAVDAAWRKLCEGAAGEVAVAAALRVLEDDQYFNAGFGGYPNVNGIVLLDVGLMRGNRDFVSLINVRRMKYPSAIALDMLEKHRSLISLWTHELMLEVERGPAEIKERYGLVATHDELIAPSVKELLKRFNEAELCGPLAKDRIEEQGHGTVGCVVRDANGRLCAGTSTGGIHLKHNGRVGDCPIIGSGVFADDEICALSTSGDGEAILLSVLSGFVIAAIRDALRQDPESFGTDTCKLRSIVERELSELRRKAPDGSAGMIIIPSSGEPIFAFNSSRFAVGMRVGTSERIQKEEILIAGEPS